jgi:hypothetical protein
VGVAQGPDGRYFGVQMFGRPKSAAIRFSVANSSASKIDYRAGERHLSLPPRAVRTHTVCRPLQLTIRLPSRPKPFTARPDDGASYTVLERAGGFAVAARRSR